ncbi:hypothetical protein D3C84_675860 [compost metagenome]
MERPPPLRAALRHPLFGTHLPHHQPQTVPRAGSLHHPARPGRHPVHRSAVHSADREPGRRAAQRPPLRRPVRSGRAATEQPAQSAQLRGPAGRGRRGLYLAGTRRAHGLRPLLHLGHHRPAQGRTDQSPQCGPARHGAEHGGQHRPAGGGRGHADGADVPRECLGHALQRGDGRRQAGVARPAGRRCRRHGPPDQPGRRDPGPGGADPVGEPRPVHAGQRPARAQPRPRRERRRRLPAGADRGHGRSWRDPGKRLGDDRAESDGQLQPRPALVHRPRRGRTWPPAGQVGARPVRRRDAHRR